MRLANARFEHSVRVVLDDGERVHRLPFGNLAEALSAGVLDGASNFDSEGVVDRESLSFAPLGGPESKVVCVGHNYRAHILEMGHELPSFPNVFSKYPDSLIGANDEIHLDGASEQWDWEAELAVVVGKVCRHVTESDALSRIAGYTVANDISARDWQRRSSQWLLGKTFERTTPVGPWLIPSDDFDPTQPHDISCTVDGVEKQRASTGDLVFGPAALVAYISQVTTLRPGDLVLSGTPGGVGTARDPVERLQPGQIVETHIAGVGSLSNRCVAATGND